MPYRIDGGRPVPYGYTPEEVLELIRKEGVKFVDLQFTDLSGRLKQVSVPHYKFDLESFSVGFNKLDGSSIRGFSVIEDSDLVLLPDPKTFAVLPWTKEGIKTARMMADVYLNMGRGRMKRDPRYIAQRAEELLKASMQMYSLWGPELEYFVFDRVSWDTLRPYVGQAYTIESKESPWGQGSYPIGFKDGYYTVPPQDTLKEYRDEVSLYLEEFGIPVEAHHHEVATAGQVEINMYRDTLTNMADSVMTQKFVSRVVAAKYGMVATFMPKPIYGDNASGMHTHVSLWRNSSGQELIAIGKEGNVFYDPEDDYAELSQLGRYFVGGLLQHSRSLAAIVAPTTNSYKRLVPGYEAPVYIAWSRANRSANVRIPVYLKGVEGDKRVEFRTPDPSCNPYLAFAAILMAGLDGIKRSMDPGSPIDEDIYKLIPERRRELGIKELPGSLKEALEELKVDNEYLRPVFEQEILELLIEREEREYRELSARPHPYEFELYFGL